MLPHSCSVNSPPSIQSSLLHLLLALVCTSLPLSHIEKKKTVVHHPSTIRPLSIIETRYHPHPPPPSCPPSSATTSRRHLTLHRHAEPPRHGNVRTLHHHAVNALLTAASLRQHGNALQRLEPSHASPAPLDATFVPLLPLLLPSTSAIHHLVARSREGQVPTPSHRLQCRAPHVLRLARQPNGRSTATGDGAPAQCHAKLVHGHSGPADALARS